MLNTEIMPLDASFLTIDSHFQPAAGRLLLAEPFSDEPYFGRSVVLLTQHSPEGSMGFVLNKPVNLMLDDIIELNEIIPVKKIPLFCGGPVGIQSLFYIHTIAGMPKSLPITDSLYVGGDFEWILDTLKTGTDLTGKMRFFLGYSGWTEGQLDMEIKHQAWVVAQLADASIISDTNVHSMWANAMKEMGGKYSRWADFPINPSLN